MDPKPKDCTLEILILTGQSGSGKSVALRALEDGGYYCVDNLPVALVEGLVAELTKAGRVARLALVMDLRDAAFADGGPALIDKLRRGPHPTRLVFLQAQDDAVIRRFSQTRRLHPLDDGRGLGAAIVREREVLRALREAADETIDTSALSPHALRQRVIEQLCGQAPGEAMRVAVLSFGFKHGIPLQADMVLDVRFLPNPYFVPELSPQNGTDPAVAKFVLDRAEAQAFLRHTMALLGFLLPHYAKEGKRYFTLAIGCTGGKHRSVALTGALAKLLGDEGVRAEVRHRDVMREGADLRAPEQAP